MANDHRWVLLTPILLALTACGGTNASDTGVLRTGSAVDEAACNSAVGARTGDQTNVISSDFAQANTLVIVGTGPDQARWRCLVSAGQVSEVTPLSSAAAL